MLETKNLTKIYKPKKGLPVKAIDNITFKLPDTGMVFLLGKSGSGKSTLLNLLGGLDKYSDGEIIIKGVSSKAFNQSHFDSYRNTYVGFIFQEYNILEEFTVGANIGLALELQGKKADSETINKILHEVDLDGYGQRKPNELSGGQKQRVAIARALVKQPEIIMADEPTGALDSNTGKQVFDTLKKLSADKLVLVVSHDREFAEGYADRIIELADGRIISDVELDTSKQTQTTEPESAKITFTDENTVELSAGYELTEEDREQINAYLRNMKEGKLTLRTSAAKASGKRFKETDQSNIFATIGSAFKLIKSRLPLRDAFRIGASGLKYKKFRLVVTIFLSVVAFGLFGLADTFGSYNQIKTCTNSIIDSRLTYASLVKAIKNPEYNEYFRQMYRISDNDIKQINEETGIRFKGVYVPSGPDLNNSLVGFDFSKVRDEIKGMCSIYSEYFSGFAEISDEELATLGYALEGRLPQNDSEIAVSKHLATTYVKFGYTSDLESENPAYETLSSEKDLIGKTLSAYGSVYTVTGIVDTGFDFDRYSILMEYDENKTSAEDLIKYALGWEYSFDSENSLTNAIFTCDGFIQRYLKEHPAIKSLDNGYLYFGFSGEKSFVSVKYDNALTLSEAKASGQKITWLDGVERTELGEKEFIASRYALSIYDFDDEKYKEETDNHINAEELLESNLSYYCYGTVENISVEDDDWKLVGIMEDRVSSTELEVSSSVEDYNYSYCVILADNIANKLSQPIDWIYERAVTAMPENRNDVHALVSWCYRTDTDTRFELASSVSYELDTLNTALKEFSKVFLWIGIFFAIFASIMFANFIGTSINYKKQEIGILRAIGSRSRDVFLIFFSESFIIAMINFILACIGTGLFTALINNMVRNEIGLLVTLLNFGIRQVAILFAVSIAVAFLASFFPTMRIAAKKPIDAIRNR